MSVDTLYKGIFAEIYDYVIPYSEEEYSFYRYFLDSTPGLALELGCGTGQLLLSFLKDGYAIEGLDCSAEMLKRCADKAQLGGLAPILNQEYMENLDLKKRYTTLLVPSASFMLIVDRDTALEALRRFYEHLIPGGQLLISLFIPWYERIDQAGLIKVRESNISLGNDSFVTWYESLTYDPVEQIRTAFYRFEKYRGDKVECVERAHVAWRWYGIYEFEYMLAKAGFKDITLYGDYMLSKPCSSSTIVCFRGIKS